MGIAQHHDAVSGTEKQEVAFDYAQRLSDGIDSALVSLPERQYSYLISSMTGCYQQSVR